MIKHPQKSDKTIAVLPFVNMSSCNDNEFFSDGITEEIINALAQIKGLKITSRTSAFYFKNKNIPIKEIGKQLSVSTILEGSVRLHQNMLRITAQLIDAKDDFHFWSETWDRDYSNIFEVQDEISQIIAEKLREHFGHFEIQKTSNFHNNDNVEAYTLYLKGKFHMNQWNPESVKKSIALYHETLSIDPQHTKAMIGLADAYSFLSTTGIISFETGWSKAAKLTQKALDINPNLPEAYCLLANITFFTKFDYKQAFLNIEKALALKQNYVEAQQFISFLYVLAGQKQHAKNHLDFALSLDPISQETLFFKAFFDYMFEDYTKALEQLNECLLLNPLNIPAHYVKTLCLIKTERFNEVLQYFDNIPEEVIVPGEQIGVLTLAHTLLKNETESQYYTKELHQLAQLTDGFTADSYLFLLYGATNQKEKAFAWIKNAIQHGAPLLLLRYSDPIVSPLKKDPRYQIYHDQLFPKELFCTKTREIKKKALLTDSEIKSLKTKLIAHIESQKPYLNPELTLRTLADQINVQANHLSYLLNKGFSKNFNEFINHYRIQTFKKRAVQPEYAHFTIISIAYECGFKSKTVFNTLFKRDTGLTPKQFLITNKA